MIIDTHLHYGSYGNFNLDFSELNNQMDKYGIDTGIISTIEGCEFRPDVDELMPEQIPQLWANSKLLKAIKGAKGRFYLSFWCKPMVEQNVDEVYEFIHNNQQLIKGLKFHPFYSRLPLEDVRYEGYIDIARQLNLPISVHTADDKLSNPEQLLNLAKCHPKVTFIMVHMGLGSDHELAIECLSKADNLIGDTTWVPMEKVRRAMELCGSESMIFGSDAPIDGGKSYVFYENMLSAYHNHSTIAWENLMFKNAQRIFRV